MLKDFNLPASFNKEVLIWYFRNSLRPFIQAQTDKQGWNPNTWKEASEKTINAETKTACHP